MNKRIFKVNKAFQNAAKTYLDFKMKFNNKIIIIINH